MFNQKYKSENEDWKNPWGYRTYTEILTTGLEIFFRVQLFIWDLSYAEIILSKKNKLF